MPDSRCAVPQVLVARVSVGACNTFVRTLSAMEIHAAVISGYTETWRVAFTGDHSMVVCIADASAPVHSYRFGVF